MTRKTIQIKAECYTAFAKWCRDNGLKIAWQIEKLVREKLKKETK